MSNEPTITLTLTQLRELLAGQQEVLPTQGTPPTQSNRYALVRGDRSGVFCGVVVSEEGTVVEMTECRHIWYWAGAANVADMSLNGVSRPGECKFIAPVDRLRVLDAVEVVDCTTTAEASLRAVPVWTKK